MKPASATLYAFLFVAICGTSRAQIAPPNAMGVSVGHLHDISKDVEGEAKFWTAIGGVSVGTGRMQTIKFPGILVLIQAGENTGGSAGSVVDHAAFLVKDAKATLAKWKEAGLNVTAPFNASNQGAFLLTPDGIRLEFAEDTSLKDPIVFHHIQWITPDPVAIKAWYVKTFGAIAGKRNNFEAADLPGGNLTFQQLTPPAVTVPTRGRALDHISFEVKDLASFCKKLEADGQKFDAPCNPRPGAATSITYITDPFGTYIELTQGLNRY